MKKPPDPDIYKCCKTQLKNITKDSFVIDRIKDAVIRSNHIIITTYQFIKAYYLYQYDNELDLPTIDKNFIDKCFKVVSKRTGGGRPIKVDNKSLLEQLTSFYNDQFAEVLDEEKVKNLKLNQVLAYAKVSMMTAFTNNIKIHFFSRLFRFVNASFPLPEDSTKEVIYKQRSELKAVKSDLVNKTLKSNPKYHDWIKAIRDKVLPTKYTKSYPYDVKANPMKYLSHMVYMNKELEKVGYKQFHCFPLRSDIVPKYVEIDTASLLELMIDKGSKQYRNGKGQIEKSKEILWDMFFKMSRKEFDYNKRYTFDYCIKTDGIGVSIRFIDKDYYGKKVKSRKRVKDNIEFPYFDELSKTELDTLKDKYNIVYIDPNKGNLIYCIDDDGNTFRYTRKQRIRETQRVKHLRVITKYKKQNGLIKYETAISSENSKSCNYENYMKYLKVKNKSNTKLFSYYEAEFLRKMKMRRFINTQRSESKMINNMKQIYEKDDKKILLAYGDCNVGKQMRHIISTPMIGLKRRLKKEFIVLNVDEYRTSCLDHRTEERNWNAKVFNSKRNMMSKLHSVLVSTILNKNSEVVNSYQNRDYNSVMNIKKIVNRWIEKRERPYRYCRNITLSED